MKTFTVSKFARNFRDVMNQVELQGEEVSLVRNRRQVAVILPGSIHQTALEAMSDLYRTLSNEAARDWVADGRKSPTGKYCLDQLRNPWDS